MATVGEGGAIERHIRDVLLLAVALLVAGSTEQSIGSASDLEAPLRGSTPIVTEGSLSRAASCGATSTLMAKDTEL